MPELQKVGEALEKPLPLGETAPEPLGSREGDALAQPLKEVLPVGGTEVVTEVL